MATNGNNTFNIIIIIILVALLIKYTDIFSISLQSPQVQYNNQPIEARFTLSNFTQPNIRVFLDNKELFEVVDEIPINGTFIINELQNQTTNTNLILTKKLINGTYILKLEGYKSEGLFKFVVSEGNITETQVIEIRNPYVDFSHNIIGVIDEDEIYKIEIRTLDPQKNNLNADSVEILVIDPSNEQQTILLDKSGNIFTYNFNYKDDGNYQFKVLARKQGFETRESTIITNVVRKAGIHPVIWVWIAALIFWLLLFGIKFLRRSV